MSVSWSPNGQSYPCNFKNECQASAYMLACCCVSHCLAAALHKRQSISALACSATAVPARVSSCCLSCKTSQSHWRSGSSYLTGPRQARTTSILLCASQIVNFKSAFVSQSLFYMCCCPAGPCRTPSHRGLLVDWCLAQHSMTRQVQMHRCFPHSCVAVLQALAERQAV
jgi:hypothetical protein